MCSLKPCDFYGNPKIKTIIPAYILLMLNEGLFRDHSRCRFFNSLTSRKNNPNLVYFSCRYYFLLGLIK